MFQANDELGNQESSCPVCGGQDFEWGRMAGQSYYLPTMNMWSVRGRQMIKIRRCKQCNALMPFADATLTRQFNRVVTIIAMVAIVIAVAVAALSFFFASPRLPR